MEKTERTVQQEKRGNGAERRHLGGLRRTERLPAGRLSAAWSCEEGQKTNRRMF